MLRPLGVVEWFPRMEVAFGIVVALAAAAALLVLLTPSTRRGAAAALATLPAGFSFLALVAIARWNYPYHELFDADRYFLPLLVPAALFAGTATAAFREWLRGGRLRSALLGLAFAVLGLEALLHRWAMLYRVSWDLPVLDVALEDAEGGEPVPLGAIRPAESARRAYDLAVPEDVSARRQGTFVRVVLASRSTWRPRDVIPQSGDERDLSVEVFRISFVKK